MEITVTVNGKVWKKYVGSFNYWDFYSYKVVYLKNDSTITVNNNGAVRYQTAGDTLTDLSS